MAKFNEILVGRFNRALQKFTGIKGLVPAPTLASEIMPVFPLPFGVENRYLESWSRFTAIASTGGAVGVQPIVKFRLPANSNIVAVLERVTLFFRATDILIGTYTPQGFG